MTHFPLLVSFREPIIGNNFLAGVTIHGRATLVDEGDGEWWVYGVEPGAVAGGGRSKVEALEEFKRQLKLVLFDIAAENPTCEEFARSVHAFFRETDLKSVAEWNAAVDRVRSGEVCLAELRNQPANSPRFVEVVQLVLQPEQNLVEEATLFAQAA